jgi:quinol monooxygenase YgiN
VVETSSLGLRLANTQIGGRAHPLPENKLRGKQGASMNGKVTVIAHIQAKPGMEGEVKKALLGLCGPTRAEKGCINYDLHQSPNDPTLFLFHENWASKRDLDAHSKSAHLQAWRKRAVDLLVEPTHVTLWSEIQE